MPFPTPEKSAGSFREFSAARPGVREHYRENHQRQTLAFVLEKKEEYLPLRRRRMGVFEALDALAEAVDASDPDLELGQRDHALQTAEALRRAGRPRWMILAGLVHDLGKVLLLYGEPQWAVVGDTFPVGCAFSERIVYPELFAENPDVRDPTLSTPNGIYEPACGLDALHLSWGHDEYLFHVLREHLPPPALAVIRYHSFYALHREGAYRQFLCPDDRETLRHLRAFNPFDLYSKSEEPVDYEAVTPYYRALVDEFLPPVLQW